MIIFTNPLGVSLPLRHVGYPELEVDLKTSFKRNMNKALRAYFNRPAALRYNIVLRFLSIERRDEFITFYKTIVGQLFTYTDYEDVSSTVRLIDIGEFQFEGRSSYTVNLTLEATST